MRKTTGSVNGKGNYRKLLLARKAGLLSGLRGQLDTLAGPGPAAVEDLAPVFHEQFVALQINRLDFLQLKLVNSALDRMDSERYGVCADCEEPISGRRLEAIPWAVRCIACEGRSNSDGDLSQFGELAA